MSDDETSGGETAPQIPELQQKLSMAHELEKMKTEADKQIQEARETVEKATKEPSRPNWQLGNGKHVWLT